MNLRAFMALVKREFQEHRGLMLMPFIVIGVMWVLYLAVLMFGIRQAGFGNFASLISEYFNLESAGMLTMKVAGVPMVICTGFYVIVALYYALDTLLAERQDRSILFWRSLPVTDTVTVLSKVFTILVAVPVIVFLAGIIGHLGGLLITTVVTSLNGANDAGGIWGQTPLLSTWGTWAYGLMTLAIWLAPTVGWFMLVSSWATRAPLLWALLPIILTGPIESIVLGTRYFAEIVWGRVTFARYPQSAFPEGAPDFANFFSAPGTWIGLGVAAVFIAGAIYLRRYREDA